MEASFEPIMPGVYRSSMLERVYWGRLVADALVDELRVGEARRIFVVTNRSLAATPVPATLIGSLGERFVGSYAGVTAHAPRSCVIEAAALARAARADLLLALGGGSVIDATKVVALCLRHGYTETAQLEPHANIRPLDAGQRPDDADQWLRIIAVPTTLSGAEFAASAGLTDPARGLKHAFVAPMQMPRAIILDPAMTMVTPLALLQSTAMKAVDHAVERMTSITANAYSDTVSELALRMLGEALDAIGERPEDLDLRSRLQFGMFMSLRGAAAGVAVNVSHAIGHVLGAHAGVPHGQTSGVVLPAVLRWNREATAAAQRRIAAAMGRSDGDAAAAVEALARRLGLPSRLREVAVKQEDFPMIARKTMQEMLLRNSRKPVGGPQDIEAILQLAW